MVYDAKKSDPGIVLFVSVLFSSRHSSTIQRSDTVASRLGFKLPIRGRHCSKDKLSVTTTSDRGKSGTRAHSSANGLCPSAASGITQTEGVGLGSIRTHNTTIN